MAKKPTLITVVTGWLSNLQIAANFQALRDALDNTVSRDGSTPNTMEADLDLNNNSIINADSVECNTVIVNGVDLGTSVVSAQTSATAAATSAADAATSADEASTSASSIQAIAAQIPIWQGAWVDATPYEATDAVETDGSSYICTASHTSATATNKPGSGSNWGDYWDLLAAKGSPGAGTGDVIAANAGSEYTGVAGTFRNNVSAMVRAITKRTGLDLATDTTIDSSIYNSDGTNTNGPSVNANGDSFISSKIDSSNYNFLWFGGSGVWLGQRIFNVNFWERILTTQFLTGTGTYIATLLADPVSGDANKVAQFDANGNIAPGFSVLDEDNMVSNSATNVPSQQSVKAYVDTTAIGVGQTWQDVKASRASGTSYQNTAGRPITVNVVISATTLKYVQVSSDNSTWVSVGCANSSGGNQGNSVVVPNNWYYRVQSGATITQWAELF